MKKSIAVRSITPTTTTPARNGTALPARMNAKDLREMNEALALCEKNTVAFTAKCADIHRTTGELTERIAASRLERSMLPVNVRKMLSKERMDRTTLTAEIPVDIMMLFAGAAAVHGLADWREAMLAYLDDNASEWFQGGAYLPEKE